MKLLDIMYRLTVSLLFAGIMLVIANLFVEPQDSFLNYVLSGQATLIDMQPDLLSFAVLASLAAIGFGAIAQNMKAQQLGVRFIQAMVVVSMFATLLVVQYFLSYGGMLSAALFGISVGAVFALLPSLRNLKQQAALYAMFA